MGGCCADSCVSNFEWTKCEWYTCYKRDEFFAGCMLGGAEFDWDGHKFEGHPNYEVGPVAEGKLVQGTRLYCFSVVMWNLGPAEGWMNSEAELANNWLNQKKGICQCDDWEIFDGLDGGSVHNIQSFIHAWKMVQENGRWKNNDWSIKVDPDAVFFSRPFPRQDPVRLAYAAGRCGLSQEHLLQVQVPRCAGSLDHGGRRNFASQELGVRGALGPGGRRGLLVGAVP